MGKFKHVGMRATNQNYPHKKVTNRLNLGTARYHSVHNILSSQLLPNMSTFKEKKTIILPTVLLGYETQYCFKART
jgi:hypothetical protein